MVRRSSLVATLRWPATRPRPGSPRGMGVPGVPWVGRRWRATDCSGAGGTRRATLSWGRVHSAGGHATAFLARWDGTSWIPLGATPNRPVLALATHAGELIVGGAFDAVGFVSASRIATWDGSQWRSVGAGVGGGGYPYVRALASYGGRLAVGGNFQHAGGITTEGCGSVGWVRVGRDGSGRPSPPGSTLVPDVHTLLEFGDNLYVAGYFSSVTPTRNACTTSLAGTVRVGRDSSPV